MFHSYKIQVQSNEQFIRLDGRKLPLNDAWARFGPLGIPVEYGKTTDETRILPTQYGTPKNTDNYPDI